ncbi:hypothetical protein ENTCAN_08617 [Enterobacter cancerogenus ATCC 35316]|nr:hypothetical protein ENTCAN_08617 [Enterobacter cancerogenus ATCC 35316]
MANKKHAIYLWVFYLCKTMSCVILHLCFSAQIFQGLFNTVLCCMGA